MISSWCARNTWNSGKSARPRRRRPPDVLASLVVVATLGQSAEAQAGYTAAQFDSSRFNYDVRSEVETVLGGRERRERISVSGLLVVTAVPDTGSRLRVEAWFDSLAVRRDSPEGSREPDTDGMIGGRYRGHLSARGFYAPQVRPFIPDAVAEVTDPSAAMDDLLPTLPPAPLRVGERWADQGIEIRRLRDSIAADTLLRFEVHRVRHADAIPAGDTARIPATQDTREEERFLWHPRLGVLRRDRTIVIETRIAPGRSVPTAVRSRVSQQVRVTRLKVPES